MGSDLLLKIHNKLDSVLVLNNFLGTFFEAKKSSVKVYLLYKKIKIKSYLIWWILVMNIKLEY